MKSSEIYGATCVISPASGKYPLLITLLLPVVAHATQQQTTQADQNVMEVNAQDFKETGNGPVYGYVAHQSTAG
ncbi:hypothetical protein, partial [Pantoea sp.]|uniref:hypothetical protein n=1 Tax=Pantoea sp. TaxID=69393 RepID=UPI0028A6F1F1